MPNYGIDLNIGRPTNRQLATPLEILNLAGIITAVEAVNKTEEEAIEELKKIREGTGMILDEDLSEEVEA